MNSANDFSVNNPQQLVRNLASLLAQAMPSFDQRRFDVTQPMGDDIIFEFNEDANRGNNNIFENNEPPPLVEVQSGTGNSPPVPDSQAETLELARSALRRDRDLLLSGDVVPVEVATRVLELFERALSRARLTTDEWLARVIAEGGTDHVEVLAPETVLRFLPLVQGGGMSRSYIADKLTQYATHGSDFAIADLFRTELPRILLGGAAGENNFGGVYVDDVNRVPLWALEAMVALSSDRPAYEAQFFIHDIASAFESAMAVQADETVEESLAEAALNRNDYTSWALWKLLDVLTRAGIGRDRSPRLYNGARLDWFEDGGDSVLSDVPYVQRRARGRQVRLEPMEAVALLRDLPRVVYDSETDQISPYTALLTGVQPPSMGKRDEALRRFVGVVSGMENEASGDDDSRRFRSVGMMVPADTNILRTPWSGLTNGTITRGRDPAFMRRRVRAHQPTWDVDNPYLLVESQNHMTTARTLAMVARLLNGWGVCLCARNGTKWEECDDDDLCDVGMYGLRPRLVGGSSVETVGETSGASSRGDLLTRILANALLSDPDYGEAALPPEDFAQTVAHIAECTTTVARRSERTVAAIGAATTPAQFYTIGGGQYATPTHDTGAVVAGVSMPRVSLGDFSVDGVAGPTTMLTGTADAERTAVFGPTNGPFTSKIRQIEYLLAARMNAQPNGALAAVTTPMIQLVKWFMAQQMVPSIEDIGYAMNPAVKAYNGGFDMNFPASHMSRMTMSAYMSMWTLSQQNLNDPFLTNLMNSSIAIFYRGPIDRETAMALMWLHERGTGTLLHARSPQGRYAYHTCAAHMLGEQVPGVAIGGNTGRCVVWVDVSANGDQMNADPVDFNGVAVPQTVYNANNNTWAVANIFAPGGWFPMEGREAALLRAWGIIGYYAENETAYQVTKRFLTAVGRARIPGDTQVGGNTYAVVVGAASSYENFNAIPRATDLEAVGCSTSMWGYCLTSGINRTAEAPICFRLPDASNLARGMNAWIDVGVVNIPPCVKPFDPKRLAQWCILASIGFAAAIDFIGVQIGIDWRHMFGMPVFRDTGAPNTAGPNSVAHQMTLLRGLRERLNNVLGWEMSLEEPRLPDLAGTWTNVFGGAAQVGEQLLQLVYPSCFNVNAHLYWGEKLGYEPILRETATGLKGTLTDADIDGAWNNGRSSGFDVKRGTMPDIAKLLSALLLYNSLYDDITQLTGTASESNMACVARKDEFSSWIWSVNAVGKCADWTEAGMVYIAATQAQTERWPQTMVQITDPGYWWNLAGINYMVWHQQRSANTMLVVTNCSSLNASVYKTGAGTDLTFTNENWKIHPAKTVQVATTASVMVEEVDADDFRL